MKKLIILCLLIFFNFNIFSQKPRLEIRLIDGINTVLFLSEKNEIDTLLRMWFDAKIIDTILTNTYVSFICENEINLIYNKYIRTDKGWEYSKTSGIIAGNPNRITSAPIPALIKESKKKREYKIIGDDLVSIKVDGVETIKDCKDFKCEREAREREYQEWLRNKDKTDKDTIK